MSSTTLYRTAWTSDSLALLLGSASIIAAELPVKDKDKDSVKEPIKDPVKEKEPEAAVKVGDDDIDIVMHGIPTKGRVMLPANDTSFKFKLHDGGVVVEFRWSELDEYERKRVQKLYGMEVASDGSLVFGEPLEGVRLKLLNGKFVEGLPIPDRDRPGLMALRTATAPLIMVPLNEIKDKETISCHESDFFSAMDIHDRRLLERPPSQTDAASQLEWARWSASIGLYGKAIEYLEAAKIIDPRTEERNQDFRAELFQRHANPTGAKSLRRHDTRNARRRLVLRSGRARAVGPHLQEFGSAQPLGRDAPADRRRRTDGGQ